MKHLGKACVFDKDHAEKYGVNGAIFLSYLFYWLGVNRDANRNYRDGKFWTYNSMAALKKIFPFWSDKQIRTTIKKLKEQGAIDVGCYNKMPFDRTQWYTLGDDIYPLEYRQELTTEISDQICETHGSKDLPERANGGNYKEDDLPSKEIPFAPKGGPICPKGRTNTSRVPIEKPVNNPRGDKFYLERIKAWGYRDEDIDRCLEWVRKNRGHLGSYLGFLAEKESTIKFVLTQVAIEVEKSVEEEKVRRRDEMANEAYIKAGLRPLDFSKGATSLLESIEANGAILESNKSNIAIGEF